MAVGWHAAEDGIEATLDTALDSTGLSVDLVAGHGLATTGACWLTVGTEQIEVASRSGETLTLAARGVNGTAAAAHSSGDAIFLNAVAATVTELQDEIDICRAVLAASRGWGDGVFRNPGTATSTGVSTGPSSALEVTVSTGLVLAVGTGAAIISTRPYYLSAAGTVTITASTGGSRTDLVQACLDWYTVSTVYGSTTPDTNCLALATVTLTTDTSTISSTDITDARVWL